MIGAFDVTKAVDFTDDEIESTYVSFAGDPKTFVDPTGSTAKFLLGGKGGGRTHLMRHLSYSLQRLRADSARVGPVEQIAAEGYLGTYLRASGLNSQRFRGKGISDDAWSAVFGYYMDLWLTQSLVKNLLDVCGEPAAWSAEEQDAFVQEVFYELNLPDLAEPVGLRGLLGLLVDSLRVIDRQVNNAALTKTVDLDVGSAPGRLVFGAAAAVRLLPGLSGIKVVFLVDELENFTTDQQKYINTLIREKELPTNFIVGSRRYGFRTRDVLGSGETNKVGSEFDQVILEDTYAESKEDYVAFCKSLISRRLERSGALNPTKENIDRWLGGRVTTQERAFNLVAEIPHDERPHIKRLRDQLTGSTSSALVRALMIDDPVLEKLAILEFYRHWSRVARPSLAETRAIAAPFHAFSRTGRSPAVRRLLGHWRGDMVAQLEVSAKGRVSYAGIDEFIEMSGYLPRSLLVILKSITAWAELYGEDPFRSGFTPISHRAIDVGVRDAAGWFRDDSVPMGAIGVACTAAVNRLGSLLRTIRYGDKPVETTCSTVTFALDDLSATAREVVEQCVVHSLLIQPAKGLRQKNSGEKLQLFQLNPMLAPLHDLPTARRGTLLLSTDEAATIFDPERSSDYARIAAVRQSSVNAPFRRPEPLRRPERGATLF